MSLRARLIVSIMAVMLAAVCLSGAVVIWNGRRQVHTELSASLAVATASVRDNFRLMRDRTDRAGVLHGLVRSFDGSRNIEAVLLDIGGAPIAASVPRRPADPPPSWLVGLLRPRLAAIRLPFDDDEGADETIVLRPVAFNETAEVWANIADDALFVLIFLGLSLLLAWRMIDWIVTPVVQLANGIAELRAGRAERPIRTRGPRELRALIGAFNRLVRDLATRDAEARALENQVARIQEEERADLARDLHDDVGPLLFLARIDIDGIARHPELRGHGEIRHALSQVVERLGRIQDTLRDVLTRLRPRREVDDGLVAAVAALLARLRASRPGILLELATEGDLALLPDAVADAAFRIVREAVHNALRHAKPGRVDVALSLSDLDRLDIAVANDGEALPIRGLPGIGLRLAREQAEAHGGSLSASAGPGGRGWTVRANLALDLHEAAPA